MKGDFLSELTWRGLLHTVMPGTEEQLKREMTTAYVGFDPSADSLHIGNLVSIMLLVHFQNHGHRPLALVGGATGMIGDPSGKSQERNLLDTEVLRHNQAAIAAQLGHFLDFDPQRPNGARMVNNYDWMNRFSFLDFIRDVGKHITVNYMMAKDSVKNRLETGLSFTEFSYQLVQAYDFFHLYQHEGCRLQMGGSDQWGNITTGTELIRRKAGGEAFALTAPLLTKADGGKFGKTESGTVWLDPQRTSPYRFYQFWLNSTDGDAPRFLRIFTLLEEEEIVALEEEHQASPHLRLLQHRLAAEVTSRVHSSDACQQAREMGTLLFGQGTTEALRQLAPDDLEALLEGLPQTTVPRAVWQTLPSLVELLTTHTGVFPSKGEARRLIQNGGLLLNKQKEPQDRPLLPGDLLQDRYLLVQKGKKNHVLIRVED